MSEENFDLNDMKEALDPSKQTNFVGRPKEDEEAQAKATAAGFGQRVDYVYGEGASTRGVAKMKRDDYTSTGQLGVVAPRIPELEAELFPPEVTYGKGIHMSIIEDVAIEVIGEKPSQPKDKFEDMALHPVMMDTLGMMHYMEPTNIQKHVIPAVLEGRDVVVSAQTGSGKTVSYLCPIFSGLMGRAHALCAPKWNPLRFNPQTDSFRAEPLVLIILPTRELAWQVFDECRRLCYRSGLRPCVAYGGGPMSEQREELQKGCDVLIATPGRLQDFLRNPKLLSLQRVRYTVIDEADEMMHEDWVEDLENILGGSNLNEDSDHVFMMFSATFPASYRKVAKQYMAPDYLRIKAGRTGAAHKNIKQNVIWTDGNRKNEALYDIIMGHPAGRTIVFVNSKITADKVDDFLYNAKLPSSSLHSDRTQREREDAITGFRNGQVPILVCTGVTARGIDVPFVLHVINYDLPSTQHGGIDEYVHRIGRTGRLGHMGLATSFFNDRNEDIAGPLAAILQECEQEFLMDITQGETQPLEEGDSDEEGDDFGAPVPPAEDGDAGDTWGAGGDTNAEVSVATEGFSAEAGADDGAAW